MAEKKTVQVNGREIPLRGLTYREVKEMSSLDMNPGFLSVAKSEEAMNHAFNLVLDQEDRNFLEEQCYSEALVVYGRIMEVTYGRSGEKSEAVKSV